MDALIGTLWSARLRDGNWNRKIQREKERGPSITIDIEFFCGLLEQQFKLQAQTNGLGPQQRALLAHEPSHRIGPLQLRETLCN